MKRVPPEAISSLFAGDSSPLANANALASSSAMGSLLRCATTASVAAAASTASTNTTLSFTPRPRSGVICGPHNRAQIQTLSNTHKARGKRSQNQTLSSTTHH
jgi:hypothetical protein